MKKACFIVPYFGQLPNTFPVFLSSVGENADFDWLIFTDNEYPGEIPQNVRFIQMVFCDLRELIQSKFQFNIALKTPYKLCDYKCAYGYIFEKYITEYDHWGYCDIDLIFGKISHFVSSEMLREYDKIGHLGHFSLYKNEEDINTMFMLDNFYVEVFTHDRIYVFDEWNEGSINRILLKYGYSLCYLDSWTDVYPHNSYLNQVYCEYDDNQNVSFRPDGRIHFFEWNKGLLYDHLWNRNQFESHEIMYVHLQKRRIMLSDKVKKSCAHLYCVPDMFIDSSEWTPIKFVFVSLIRRIIDIKRIRFRYKSLVYFAKETIHSLLKGISK